MQQAPSCAYALRYIFHLYVCKEICASTFETFINELITGCDGVLIAFQIVKTVRAACFWFRGTWCQKPNMAVLGKKGDYRPSPVKHNHSVVRRRSGTRAVWSNTLHWVCPLGFWFLLLILKLLADREYGCNAIMGVWTALVWGPRPCVGPVGGAIVRVARFYGVCRRSEQDMAAELEQIWQRCVARCWLSVT